MIRRRPPSSLSVRRRNGAISSIGIAGPCEITRLARAVIIAAPASGSGKTVLTLGLLRALKSRGVRVASAKVGPDYIDPQFHAAATSRPCFNLDPWAMSTGQIASLLEELEKAS